MIEEWEPPLNQRYAGTLLSGIDVFYDFSWNDVFGHGVSKFPNGKALTQLVREDCPEGLRPTLILTVQANVEEGTSQTDERFIVVVRIHDYLSLGSADPAATYYARSLGARITDLSRLQNVDLSGDDLQAFIDLHLNAEAIIRWVARDRSRLEPIRQLISECPELLSDVVDLSPLEDQVRALEQLSPEVLSAFFDQLLEIRDPDSLVKAFSALTESDTGRHVATDVLAGRLTERLSDARNYAHEYSTLIATEGVIETDVQNFIEEHPWLVGLHYVRVRHKVSIPRGEVDFILERYDGFYDLLELKGPEDVIIADPAPNESRQPSPPSSFSLGPSLAQALAQVHYYRHILDSSAGDVAELYGLTRTRHPRLIILIGRASDLSDTSRHLLTQLNISLHRVEIVPYDILGSRIEGLVKNVEDYLSGTGDSVT